VAVFGIDGGGLDDLLGLSLVGRERDTRRWLHWSHAWAHKIVLERRKDIVSQLRDFEQDGDLTIVDRPGDDIDQLADIICQVRDAGLLPDQKAIGVDSAGIGDIIDELTTYDRGITMDQIVAVSQGWRLNGAIKTTERKVAGGELVHGATRLMAWCVGNARTVAVGNAIAINKQVSGSAKIDPLMATFDATTLMALNPAPSRQNEYQMFFV
jgi:phage terminase large subunit-like protein